MERPWGEGPGGHLVATRWGQGAPQVGEQSMNEEASSPWVTPMAWSWGTGQELSQCLAAINPSKHCITRLDEEVGRKWVSCDGRRVMV